MTEERREHAPPGRIVRATLRSLATVAILTTIFYLLPMDRFARWIAICVLVFGLALLVALVTYQVRTVMSAAFPALRAIESLAVSIPLFLLLFASSYLAMTGFAPHSFNQPMTHTDALYFTVTVFSTVGFGDIVATTEAARLVVTAQMISDLLIIGIAIRAILTAVQRRREQL